MPNEPALDFEEIPYDVNIAVIAEAARVGYQLVDIIRISAHPNYSSFYIALCEDQKNFRKFKVWTFDSTRNTLMEGKSSGTFWQALSDVSRRIIVHPV